MLNILLYCGYKVSKIISLVIFVCLAMWSIRNLKVHDVSCASATLHLVIITTVSKGLLYSTGGPAERSIIRSIIGTITHNAYWSTPHGDRPITRPLDSAAGSANAPGLLADAYGTQPINGPAWLGPSAEWNRPVLAGRTASVHGGVSSASKIRFFFSLKESFLFLICLWKINGCKRDKHYINILSDIFNFDWILSNILPFFKEFRPTVYTVHMYYEEMWIQCWDLP